MNVLVTGAGRGIGRAIALAFGRDGHRVMLGYRSRRAEAEAALAALREQGAEADLYEADVSKPAQAQALVEAAARRWGSLDGLINNAGVTRDRTILKMSDDEWGDVIDVNLSGAFWCLRAAAQVMTRQKNGFIVNIASLMGLRGGYGCANYAASKAGLIGLTKSAARELGRFNVRVNAVLPGYHPTEMNASLPPEQVEKIREEHALGRFPDLEELARFVLNIAKQKSASGQVFNFESRVV